MAAPEFTVHVRISEFEIHAYGGQEHDHHPMVAFVGSAVLRTPGTNRVLCSRLEHGPLEFDLTFGLTKLGSEHRYKYPAAIMMQLHTHRQSDDGDLIEVNAATGDRYLWLWELAAQRSITQNVTMRDYPMIAEREVFESVGEEVMNYVQKASFKVEWTLVDAGLPSALQKRLRTGIELEHFTGVVSKAMVEDFRNTKARLERTMQPGLPELFDYDTFVYDVGSGIRLPAGVLVSNRSYAESASEALYEGRIQQLLRARRVAPERFVEVLRTVCHKFKAYSHLVDGRSADVDAAHMAPTDEELETMNLVVEALLVLPVCALPYTHDQSELDGADYVEVEQIDNSKKRRAFDCEDTATEISMTHEDLVRGRALWRSKLVRLSAKLLSNYECLVTRVITTPKRDADGRVSLPGSVLHVCAILVLRQHLFQWIKRGVDRGLSPEFGDDVVLQTAKSTAYKPEWWYRSSKEVGHPSSYFTNTELPYATHLTRVQPPGRVVLLADGCSVMQASQGPPALTHPQSAHYFAAVEKLRESAYTAILRHFADANLEHEYPLEWADGDQPARFSPNDVTTSSQSRYYHAFVGFSARNPLFTALREHGQSEIPTTAHTLNTVVDYLFVNSADGTVGVKFDALFTSDLPEVLGAPPFVVVPRGVMSLSLVQMCVDTIALQEPVYPMYAARETPELSIDIDQHEKEVGTREHTNVFVELPLHVATYSKSLVEQIMDLEVPGLGRPVRREGAFINVGACCARDESRFIGEPKINVNLAELGLGLSQIQRMLSTVEGKHQLQERAGSQTAQGAELWYLTAYEKVLQEPIGVFFTRYYFPDEALVGHMSSAGGVPEYHV